ncbi:MAG: hypothetical protein E7164_04570 [Firmicutes bacterium]|nr:hypothetical protein [Bacillota bacterium]
MGKKKTVDINGTPLESVTIGQIKKGKFGWLGMLTLFVLFGGVIYFLPELTALYQKYLSGSTPSLGNTIINNTTNNTVEKPNEDEEPPVDTTVYTFGSDVTVELNGLIFSEISYINNVLAFKVSNTTESSYNLKDNNLYFQTYDNATDIKMALNTIALKGELPPSSELNFSFEIREGAKNFDIKEILEEDYTYVTFTPDENDNIVLTCSKDEQKLKYTFHNDKLTIVEESMVVLKNDVNYDSLYRKYNTIVVKYGLANGIEAKMLTNFLNMTFSIRIDYSNFTGKIDNDYYFEKDTNSRIVNFIMESELFKCS